MNEYLASNISAINPDTQFIGLRFFNIFGPWQDPAGDYSAVIPKWIDMILKNQQPVIFGNGEATRDFCYVENICNLIEGLGKTSNIFLSDIFNIASGSSINLTKLANLILSTIQRSGAGTGELQPVYQDMRAGEIIHSSASINKAQTILGFNPKIDLNTGVENILRLQYGFRF
jgi:nucleoside-diphosphate-sugar epimerase